MLAVVEHAVVVVAPYTLIQCTQITDAADSTFDSDRLSMSPAMASVELGFDSESGTPPVAFTGMRVTAASTAKMLNSFTQNHMNHTNVHASRPAYFTSASSSRDSLMMSGNQPRNVSDSGVGLLLGQHQTANYPRALHCQGCPHSTART